MYKEKLTRHLPTQLLLDQLNLLYVLFTMQPIREKLGVINKTKGSLDRERIKKLPLRPAHSPSSSMEKQVVYPSLPPSQPNTFVF